MKLTQLQRIERAGLTAGQHGITQVDFLLPNVIDGKAPITRLAARIKDSRDQGARWTVTGERDGCAIYILDPVSLADATKPDAAPAVPSSSPAVGAVSEPAALFDTPPRRVSPYHEEAA